MTAVLDRPAQVPDWLLRDLAELARGLTPLPGPAWPHRITRWGDNTGGRHWTCACSPDTDPADPACLDWSRLLDLLQRTCALATATRDATRNSWAHPAWLKARARRERGMALLGLIVAAGEPSSRAQDDASPTAAPDASAHEAAPGPVAGRGEPGDSGPSPACHPEQSDAHLAPGAEPDATPTPAPSPAATPDPLPAGYVRLSWVCGHSAGGPARHGWADHRHPCPECNLHPLDRRCPGVHWAAPRRVPLAAVHVRRCALCGTEPARPYPNGSRCDSCSPWAVAGRPPSTRPPLPRTPPPPPHLETV